GFAVQPALKFFVFPYFGPAKDGIVVIACASALIAAVQRIDRHRRDALIVSAVILLGLLYVANPAGGHGSEWANGTRLVLESLALFVTAYLGPSSGRTWRWAI